jgi:hypothetical protein
LPAHQVIERGHHALNRRHGIEVMELQQIDVIGAQTLERFVGGADQVMA